MNEVICLQFLVKIQEITLSQAKHLRTLCIDITLLPWKQAKGIIAEIKVLGSLRSRQKKTFFLLILITLFYQSARY